MTTQTGFEYSIDERIRTDWDFVKSYQELQKDPGNIFLMEKIFTKLLTEKGFEKLKKHVAKQNDGFLPMEKLVSEFKDIISTNEEIKK